LQRIGRLNDQSAQCRGFHAQATLILVVRRRRIAGCRAAHGGCAAGGVIRRVRLLIRPSLLLPSSHGFFFFFFFDRCPRLDALDASLLKEYDMSSSCVVVLSFFVDEKKDRKKVERVNNDPSVEPFGFSVLNYFESTQHHITFFHTFFEKKHFGARPRIFFRGVAFRGAGEKTARQVDKTARQVNKTARQVNKTARQVNKPQPGSKITVKYTARLEDYR
jgi:hypothetical protein